MDLGKRRHKLQDASSRTCTNCRFPLLIVCMLCGFIYVCVIGFPTSGRRIQNRMLCDAVQVRGRAKPLIPPADPPAYCLWNGRLYVDDLHFLMRSDPIQAPSPRRTARLANPRP